MCPHNQQKYDNLTALINKDEEDLAKFENIKKYVIDMKTKHEEFNIELKNAITNLENNTLVANKKFDEGLLEENYKKVDQFIVQCEEVIKKCTSKISDLVDNIQDNKSKRNWISQNCWSCFWKKLFGGNNE